MTSFGRQQISTTFSNLDLALGTGTTAAASTAHKDARIGESTEQLSASGDGNLFLAVDHDFDGAGRNQLALGSQNQQHQRDHHDGEHDDAKNDDRAGRGRNHQWKGKHFKSKVEGCTRGDSA